MELDKERRTVDTNEDQVYVRLQQHLDSQAVGFPATRSGAEIKILKHIFTSWEAEIATCLSYRPEPIETLFERALHLVGSPDELASLLDGIQKKGGIETKIKDGKKLYCNAPLVVGMYEMQLKRLTPEFIRDFNEYTSDKKFGVEFLSTDLPQMRTIPIGKSIMPQHHVGTFDEVSELLRRAEAPFVIVECICRKKRAMEDKPCKVTDRKETCLAIGGTAQSAMLSGNGREISRDEAMAIIEQNQKEGLVLQPSNTEKADFICSCCGCCCGMLGLHKKLPKPLDFWASNFHAVVDMNGCDGCGACEKRCQVGAVSVSEKKQPAVVDLNRCIGCGLCVPTCPKKAISLLKKPNELIPPQTREDLYDIIMANKKGKSGKIKLTGKLFFDAIRTGRTDLR
jgi:Na+-translocating ferredoxin:NAD+ oxidoreductase subunit B